jgi:predicted transposase/invertase (TIGR01784 family)
MTNVNTNDSVTVNRTFKSTLFIMLFEDRKNLLELYNAITGKHYADPELLEINTLENAIYMSMKNDVSFLIDGRLSLYEHQSTKNPNLPLRFLLYISHLYSRLTVKANLYGERIVQIPAPEFIIFYNGKDEMPERQLLKLSDMYSVKEEKPKLELEATLLNISGTNNRKLKEACRTLRDYAIYTDKIRGYTETMELPEAVDRAINECIEEDVLRDFLMEHKAEARAMSIFEYDQERHMQQEREAGIEKGEQQLLRRLVQKNLARGMSIPEIAEVLDETEERIREIAAAQTGEEKA